MSFLRRSALLIPILFSTAASGAGGVPQTSGFASFFQALMGLLIVLGLLYGFFWLLRRFGAGQVGTQGAVKIVGGVMLGPRERLVVVEVQDTWLLVGVAAGHVSTLHSLPRPEGVEVAAKPASPAFAERLSDLLKRQKG